MAYVWNHQNHPQQPIHHRNQPATPYFPSITFGTVPPLLAAQIAADHALGGGLSTNVVNYSEGRPNSSGRSREDDALMMSVLDESINQENPSPTDGLSLSIIARNLKTRDCNFVRQGDDEDVICVVCQDGLSQENEKIGILDCGHEYHQDCIGRWLLQRNFCPVCKATAIHLD
ncbi:hypothetical protein ACJIZ3_013775 [Penstemon smallii]|uniref:RING-type E3 ubiquitin transferase n=1 Tax=Penstemon smallii TaxID=265156 RepID=A0ABD3RHK9_9LAMI